MANAGNLPSGISFVSFSKPTTNVFTVAHGLGEVPDMVMIFQKSYDVANGGNAANPLLLFANQGDPPSGSTYPKRLIVNYIENGSNWTYTGNSIFGWSADSTNVEIKFGNSSPPFPNAEETWYMLSVKFKD